VPRIDAACVNVLERLSWRPFRGVGQATISLLGAKSEGRNKRRRPNRLWGVPSLSFRPISNIALLLLDFLPEQ